MNLTFNITYLLRIQINLDPKLYHKIIAIIVCVVQSLALLLIFMNTPPICAVLKLDNLRVISLVLLYFSKL